MVESPRMRTLVPPPGVPEFCVTSAPATLPASATSSCGVAALASCSPCTVASVAPSCARSVSVRVPVVTICESCSTSRARRKSCVTVPEVCAMVTRAGTVADEAHEQRGGAARVAHDQAELPVVAGEGAGRGARDADLRTGDGAAALVGHAAGDGELRLGGRGRGERRDDSCPEIQA
jgi:hypothetical protein